MSRFRGILVLSPLRIAAGYVVFGILWILISDRLVASAIDSTSLLVTVQTIKGWVFVGVSGLLIFALTHVHHGQVATSRSNLQTAHQQLQVLYRVFRHNIRNDMTVIRGNLELVRERVTNERICEYVETADDKAAEILTVSEKLTLINDVGPRPIEERSIDIVELTHQACDRIKSDHPEISISTSLPTQAMVVGDDSLKYALQEVLENAVEHHDQPPSERRISVDIDIVWDEVTVHIRDNGPGIPEGELQAIREGQETQLIHSSGVGLWLVQWFCRFHGGEVELEPGPDRGTGITLRFVPASGFPSLKEFGRRDSPLRSILP